MKDLFESIRDQLKTKLPELKIVALFNNQFENSNNDDTRLNTIHSFDYPAVFIELSAPAWKTNPEGIKYGPVDIKLRIGFRSMEFEDLDVFDLRTKIIQALERFKGAKFTGLDFVSEVPDYNHDNVYVYELNFRTEYRDESTHKRRDAIELHPWTFTTNGEVL